MLFDTISSSGRMAMQGIANPLVSERIMSVRIRPGTPKYGRLVQWENKELITLKQQIETAIGYQNKGETPQGEVAVCNTVAETHGWVRFPPLPPIQRVWGRMSGNALPLRRQNYRRFKSGQIHQ